MIPYHGSVVVLVSSVLERRTCNIIQFFFDALRLGTDMTAAGKE